VVEFPVLGGDVDEVDADALLAEWQAQVAHATEKGVGPDDDAGQGNESEDEFDSEDDEFGSQDDSDLDEEFGPEDEDDSDE